MEPGYETGRFAAVSHDEVAKARTAQDVVAIIERMCSDLRSNPTAWENGTLSRFLDALGGYLTDAPDPAAADAATWQAIARALVVATGYE